MDCALYSKAYKVFNKTSLIVEESIHIVFEKTHATLRKDVVDDNVDIEDLKIKDLKEKEHEDSKEEPPLEDLQRNEDQYEDLFKAWKFVRDHPIDQVIGDPIQGVRTRGALKNTYEYVTYISQMEPKNFKEAKHKEN